jgi:transposase
VAKEVERLVLAHPLHPVLTSMPGVGVRTAARLLIDVASRAFASAGHLAAYAGLAPVTRRSGSSIRGEHPSRRGNKQLKRAMFLSAFAALRDPISRAYYARKIAQGKRHNQALIALARRRCDVPFAMLRDGTLYSPPATEIH